MKAVKLYLFFILQFISICSSQAQVVWDGKKQNPDDLVLKALAYLREGNTRESIQLSQRVLALYPKYLDFKYILGLNYQKTGQLPTAITTFQEVIETDPGYKDAYTSLALSYASIGDLQKSKETWIVAKDKYPNDQEIDSLYSDFLIKESKIIKDRKVEDWNIEVKRALANKDAAKVIALSDSLETYAPKEDLRYLYIRSKGYQLAEDYAKAKSTLEQIIARGDTSLSIVEQLAITSAAQKDFAGAVGYMNQLVYADPFNYHYQKAAKVYRENIPYKNYFGINHTHIAIDRPAGWNFITGIEYGRKVGKKSTIIGLLNYGNRRGEKGYQAGVDAWLNYTDALYAYHHIAYADGAVFPSWRAAYSIYREAGLWLFDIGGRYVRSSDKINNYSVVGSAGRYIGPTLVYFRTFIMHDSQRWNQAYSLSLRHYYNEDKPDSYVTLIGNVGTSPDDPARYQFLNNSNGLLSRSLNAGWQHRIENWGLGVMGGWSYFKITEKDHLNQFDLNLSLKKYF